MRKVIFILVLITHMGVYSQSKVSANFGIGNQWLGKDSGEFYEGVIGYRISDRLKLNLSAINANLRTFRSSDKYKILKYSIFFNYGFNEKKYTIEPVFGVSYLDFKDNSIIEKNSMFGIDIGMRTFYSISNKARTGVKYTNTYSYYLNGGIMNISVFFEYNL